ncbi:MAG TPA: EamA family transporter [Acidimicrobiales bacterium]|nr:EamA family transporter [Acidimicrobiales bacterium]
MRNIVATPHTTVTRRRPVPGVVMAGLTALVSGVSVFVNAYGVHAVRDPALYTTAKNLVAALLLAGATAVAWTVRGRRPDSGPARYLGVAASDRAPGPVGTAHQGRRSPEWLGLAYVGVVGGGLAFVLFFDGLADSAAAPAAFWHDTLVIWVALLAGPLLRERPAWWNLAAVGVLVAGEVAITGGVGHLAADRGTLLVLGATILWSVEVVMAKVLLRHRSPGAVALTRMAVGGATLVVYLAATGAVHGLVTMGAGQLGWVLLTGALLACYVATWLTALARARALDVTSVLVAGALVTALLQLAAGTSSLGAQALGLVLVAVGAALVGGAALRRVRSVPSPSPSPR